MKSNFLSELTNLSIVMLFLLAGCNTYIQLVENDSETGTTSASYILPREHHEFTDSRDGLFVTYWERYYERGLAEMNIFEDGYTFDIDYTGVVVGEGERNPCIVVGKGIKPCRGQTISWDIEGDLDASAFGIYGWLREPLVEYYIGRSGGTKVGTYTTDQGTYTLYLNQKDQENIINPTPPGSKFLQFNCDGPGASPINMSQHYAAWEALMDGYALDPGWVWHSITLPDYCVVATEVYGLRTGYTKVVNIHLEDQ